MKNRIMTQLNKWFSVGITILMVGCAPKATLFKTPQKIEYPTQGIQTVQLHVNALDAGKIKLPISSDAKKKTKPVFFDVTSEQAASIKSLFESILESQLIQTERYDVQVVSVLPKAAEAASPEQTAQLKVTLKYHEGIYRDSEKLKYVLMAINNGGSSEEKLVRTVVAKGVTHVGEKEAQGFEEPTAYTEIVAALEIEIELIRLSDQKVLLPKQTLKSFYTRKWGGAQESSRVSSEAKAYIEENFQEEEGFLARLNSDIEKTQLAREDPEAYLAQGYHLHHHDAVPLNSLGTKLKLIQKALKPLKPF